MSSLMLSEPIRFSSTKSFGCHLFLVLSDFLSSNFFLHMLVSDVKFTHKICSLAQFSFHLFHAQCIWFRLAFLPDASPRHKNSLHLGHFTSALFHYFQSPKKVFLVSLEHDVMFLSIAFFNVFLQLQLLVMKLIKPLLLNDS